MALTAKSTFLYGYEVTADNSSIDFRAVSLETPRQATLTQGFYSSTSLALEVARAMQAVDALNTYTVTIDRTVMGGTQNRMTISTSGSFLSLLFASGPRTASTAAPLLGFATSDRTGATTYTGTSSTGTIFQTSFYGYNFLSPDFMQKVLGNVNIAASGLKETIVFQVQKFWQVDFRYEPASSVNTNWIPFITWAIQQRPLEFTPEVSSPSTFYEGTLEKTEADGKGLALTMTEMLPQFPNFYKTGLMTFRQTIR